MRKRSFSFSTLFILISLLGSYQARAQDPSFEAIASSKQVLQNSVFEVQFELKNASGENFQPPDFNSFTVVGGPAMGSSTIIINGEVTRSQSWTYSLLAQQAGNFTIGSAQIVSGRRKLSSKPISITVVAAEDIASGGSPGSGQEPIKLIAHVKPGEYYPGQQIVLEYKLLFRENIQSANTISEDDYADFFVQNFNSFSNEATYETINGTQFASRIVKAVALFAHQSGQYTIDPMVLMVGINAPYPSNQGFFTMRRLHNIQIASAPLTINILPLPADQSTSVFSGAVGQYTLRTLPVSGTSVSTDEDFILRIEVRGDGDARRWDPPVPRTDGDFEIYDPKILDDKMIDENGAVQHTRVIEYVMIPKQPGQFSIHVPFTFFNPVTKKYETVSSDTISLMVSQGNNVARHAASDSSFNSARVTLKKVRNISTDDRFWLSIPHLLLFSLILAGTGYGLWISYKRKRENEIPNRERLRSSASRNARLQLDDVSKESGQMPDVTFYERITEIYYKFLSEKFNILPADLDAEKILHRFGKSGVEDSISHDAIAFYNECLSLRYGAAFQGYSREQLTNKCRHIIDSLESVSSHHI